MRMFVEKKLYRSFLLSAVLLLLCTAGALAGGSYIDLQMGPRPQAMGGAFVAVADDVNSAYWNPAGIVQVEDAVIGFMHTNPFNVSEVSLDYIAFVHPTALSFINGGVGLSYQRLSAQLEELKDKNVNEWVDSMYTLSLGGRLLKRLFYGVNFKSINIETSPGVGESTAGEALDLGLLYQFDDHYSLGLMMRNLSGKLTDETIAPEKRIGIAGRFWDNKVILAIDASHKQEIKGQEELWQFHWGAEVQVTDNIAVRAGFDRDYFTGGIGIHFDMGGLMKGASLDYSYTSNEELEYTNRFALAVELGGVE